MEQLKNCTGYYHILKLGFCLIFLTYSKFVFSQKAQLTEEVFGNWQYIAAQPVISHDGKYVIYGIEATPRKGVRSIYVKNLTTGKEVMIENLATWDLQMSENGHYFFYSRNDSLGIYSFGADKPRYIPKVQSYKLINQKGTEYLYYQSDEEFVRCELSLKNRDVITSVNRYWLSDFGDKVAFTRKSTNGKEALYIYSFKTKRERKLLDDKIDGVAFSKDGSGIAIVVRTDQASIWYFKDGMSGCKKVLEDRSLDKHVEIASVQRFGFDGNDLFVNLRDIEQPEPEATAVMVDVWNYKDPFLQSQQMQMDKINKYLGVLDLKDEKFTRLSRQDEKVILNPNASKYENFQPLILRSGLRAESHWNPTFRLEEYILSTKTGEKEKLSVNFAPLINFSSTGRYCYAHDNSFSDILVYDLSDKKQRNLTKNLPVPLYDDPLNLPGLKQSRGFKQRCFWLSNDEGVFVMDRFDIWLLDPTGKKAAKNITNGFGRKHKIEFAFAAVPSIGNITLRKAESYILKGFNTENKTVGFYRVKIDKADDPALLSEGPYNYMADLAGEGIVRARDKEIYLVLRSDVKTAPNIFLTKDFKTFSKTTNINPENKYWWLTSELHSWISEEGKPLQGILYKPENFDPKKRYPVLFNFYERMSDELNKYRTPEPTSTFINIPWFLSKGYLVFCPDITYTIGHPGNSVWASLESAAKYLSKFHFVDSARLGLQGHSFGGYETNYIITRSKLFKAAVTGAGTSNLISKYGTILGAGGENAGIVFTEDSQDRMGASPWEAMDLYIENSPVFNAQKVNTPLLIGHASSDGLVPFSQAVEYFVALRRLNKKVWMLQYDKAGHHIDGQNGLVEIDYTHRIEQFFGHYLKSEPAPVWMTRGVPFKLKGIKTGLEIDSTGVAP